MLNVKQPEVFEEIFHAHYASLCYFANKFTQDKESAKDIVQEVFANFWTSKGSFENSTVLKSFLYSCVKNAALNYLNKQRLSERWESRLDSSLFDPDEVLCFEAEADVFEEIFAVIEELPEECKRIFKMSYIEHLDIKSMVEQLNIAESTIKTQRQRAKKFLRERLQHLYPVVVFIFF